MKLAIRKIATTVEDIRHDGGPELDVPLLRGGVCCVMTNPYAGKFVEDIMPMMEALKPVGLDMAGRLIAALGGDPAAIEVYGKGAIVGEAGELEHGALWHVPGGYGMRELLGESKAIVPSTKKLGGLGARIDIPLHHVNAAYVRSHFNTIELGVPDGPKADEIVFCLAMATGGRPHARVGGLDVSEITGEDGLR